MEHVKIILGFVFLIFGVFLVSALEGPIYYNLEVYYDRGDIVVRDVKIEFTQKEVRNFYDEEFETHMNLEVRSLRGDVLEKIKFSIPNIGFYDIMNESTGEMYDGGIIEFENVSFGIYLQYYENAREIVISSEDDVELSSRDISEFSRGVVLDENEKEDKLKDKEEIDIEEVGEVDDEKDIVQSGKYLILISLLVVLFILLVYLFLRKGSKQVKKRMHKSCFSINLNIY